MTLSIKQITPLLISLLLIAVGLTIILSDMSQSLSMFNFLTELTYISIIIALVASYWFNTNRVFFIALTLLAGQLAISYYHTTEGLLAYTLYMLVAVIAPLNILIACLLKDGAVLSYRGKLSLGLLLSQTFLVLIFVFTPSEGFQSFFDFGFIPFSWIPSPLPSLAMLCFMAVLGVLIVIIKFTSSLFHSLMIGVLIALFLSFQFGGVMGSEIFTFIGSLLLIAAVVYRSYAMAYLDELTRIPSRRKLENDLLKLGNQYAIAMLDIDHFKKFNDTYGHDIGDEVLKLVASGLEKVTGGGKAYRYGGEEFTIVFPRKRIKEVLSHLDDLRQMISKQGYTYQKNEQTNPKKLYVTISIGVAERDEQSRKPEEVIKAADNALYRAKKKGRNCVSQ